MTIVSALFRVILFINRNKVEPHLSGIFTYSDTCLHGEPIHIYNHRLIHLSRNSVYTAWDLTVNCTHTLFLATNSTCTLSTMLCIMCNIIALVLQVGHSEVTLTGYFADHGFSLTMICF